MTKVLTLATAGLHNGQLSDIHHDQFPRVDYIEMKRYLDMDVLDYTTYEHSRFGRYLRYGETKLRSDLYLTFLGLVASGDYQVTFTMSERAGTPFSGLRRLLPANTPLVTMFQRWSWRQERTTTKLNLFSAMDSIIVHCQSMKSHLVDIGAPAERIHVIHYGVDQKFFTQVEDVCQEPGFIFSLGEASSRNYEILSKAVTGLPVNLLIAASGHWYAREKDTQLNGDIPANVSITSGIPSRDLRDIYARAQFVALPVHDTIYSAGSTAVLESMCMGRAVIVSRTPGISDYVIDGVTGIMVESGDEYAWREAIQYLLAHPEEASRMGCNARQRVEEELNLDIYIENLARILGAYL